MQANHEDVLRWGKALLSSVKWPLRVSRLGLCFHQTCFQLTSSYFGSICCLTLTLRHSPTHIHAHTHTLSFLPSQWGRIHDRSMLKSQLNCAKAQLMGIGGGFHTCPSISHNASRIRLFLFHVVKPADTGPFCRSNRASSDVTQTTEVAWGEQLETHTCTHTWQKAQKVDFFLKSSSVIWTFAAESCRPRRVSQTDIEMLWGGPPQLVGWREGLSLCEVAASLPPFENVRKKERRNGALSSQGWLEGGKKKNRTRSVYDSTLCEGRLPCVSLQLS